MTGTCGVYDLRVDLQSAPSLRLDGHHGGVTSACFGADGDHFAYTSARRDNRISVSYTHLTLPTILLV